MLFMRALVAAMVCVVILGFSGCCGGGSKVQTETKTTTTTTTLGQELKDLEEAYQKGIISEKEYNESKEKLLKQRTKD